MALRCFSLGSSSTILDICNPVFCLVFTPIKTGDGSSTFYSAAFGEWFHSREGASREAQQTYVETTRLAERSQQASPLKILDICYGLGYNTAAALETIWQANDRAQVEIKALEIDIEVGRSAIAHQLTRQYSPAVQQVLNELAAHCTAERDHLSAHILLGDARQQIQPLVEQGWQADVIFLDPFSPPHCPQLWTVEFLQRVAQCLNPNGGELVTYSCAAAVRSALKLVGLSIESTQAGGRKWPGTLARYSSDGLPALSQQEQEHLQTRAAVPYRDPTLQSSAEEILTRRAQAQAISPLAPTAPWRRRWAAARR